MEFHEKLYESPLDDEDFAKILLDFHESYRMIFSGLIEAAEDPKLLAAYLPPGIGKDWLSSKKLRQQLQKFLGIDGSTNTETILNKDEQKNAAQPLNLLFRYNPWSPNVAGMRFRDCLTQHYRSLVLAQGLTVNTEVQGYARQKAEKLRPKILAFCGYLEGLGVKSAPLVISNELEQIDEDNLNIIDINGNIRK